LRLRASLTFLVLTSSFPHREPDLLHHSASVAVYILSFGELNYYNNLSLSFNVNDYIV
jgi:hypothetical protein